MSELMSGHQKTVLLYTIAASGESLLAFPKGSLAMKLRDELGMMYTDEQFSDLFPERG